jgi:hypothetical protein
MADYYSQCVVQPSLPTGLVDAADRLVLEGLGYTFEEDGEDWYLFAAEGENSAVYGINPNDWLEVLDDVYPEGVERPAWLVMLATHLQAALNRDTNLCTMIASDWDLDFTAVPLTGADVFQGLLQKPVNSLDPERQVREITIEGSFSCSKMRPDGFGGWVEHITASGIRYDSTQEILERWSNDNEPVPDAPLLEAAKAVLASWEHGDLAAAVRQLAAAVATVPGGGVLLSATTHWGDNGLGGSYDRC